MDNLAFRHLPEASAGQALLIQTAAPAHLIVGPAAHTYAHARTLIQQALCAHGCGTCMTCKKIEQKNHHAVMWIEPEKAYTLAHLDDLMHTLSLNLEPDEFYFFVLTKADTLTTACANRLLKSLEEPPAGYRFLLLVEHVELTLPTVRSRCILHTAPRSAHQRAHETFVGWFTHMLPPAATFTKYLDEHPIGEHESRAVLDMIFSDTAAQYSASLVADESAHISTLIKKIEILKKSYHHLPMPGSSKLFWKNIFIQLV